MKGTALRINLKSSLSRILLGHNVPGAAFLVEEFSPVPVTWQSADPSS
jgi:hypothetical protein